MLVLPSENEGLIFGSGGERFCFHSPAEGLGHGSVEVGDELLDFGAQRFLAVEIPAAEELSHQDGEPDFDLVEPRSVSGREVEGNAMVGLAQEGGAGDLGSKHAGLTLDAELVLEPAVARDEPETASERWILRLSQTISHRMLGAALLSKRRRKRAKSFSVRVMPITPSILPVATSKAAIRV